VDYFLETVDAGGLRPASRDEVEARAGAVRATLILCGHTHLQRSCVLEDGRFIVNPGSVGLPSYEDEHPFPHKVQSGSPHARYAIVERSENRWKVEMLQVEYDWERAADAAEKRGRPDWARALRTGL
jgi:predicted phosphodiesterase